MKLIKQITVICILVVCFGAFDFVVYNTITKRYINHTSKSMQAKSIELDKYLPFDDDSAIVKVESTVKLENDLPTVDGAAALYPVFSAFVNAIYPESSVDFDGENFTEESKLHFSNTRGAYKSVVDKDADIIFCAKPSDAQLAYAKENGVELELVPIGYEAFVFIVNSSNPVDDLSVEQVQKIYSGEYSRWSQVGGDNRYIDALQRNEGSGSQTAMISFMGDCRMKKRPVLFNGSAIGYSFRYYVEGIVSNGDIKMLSLNGVYPDKDNIADKSYPVVGNLYAIYDKCNDNKNIPIFIDWILSDEGQSIVEESGYVPISNSIK